ncbi:MAG: GNAT family N-acetyltransferase [Roseburia sp.]
MQNYQITHLPRKEWENYPLPMGYRTGEYYDVTVTQHEDGFAMNMEKKEFDTPVTHTPEEYDFPDRLYEPHWQNACAWGVLIDGALVAAIETDQELWSNRLRITELWVDEKYQKQGIGHALMEVAKEQARLERRRAIILETQSCNANAIGFYLHEGFTLIGFDSCCYRNDDLARKEVRIELGFFPEQKKRLSREEIEIRPERSEDYREAEEMTRQAFWNRHQKGCNEHYLVHKLRNSPDYLPELSRIAVKDGKVIGGIWYSRSKIKDGAREHEVLTFGPLCVASEWHGCGVGGMLLEETLALAKEAGWPGVVIFGEPDYYPLHGFVTCDKLDITTPDGRNFDAFMGIVLDEEKMARIHGKFYEAEVFEQLPKAEAEAYDEHFPGRKKRYFPMQWD